MIILQSTNACNSLFAFVNDEASEKLSKDFLIWDTLEWKDNATYKRFTAQVIEHILMVVKENNIEIKQYNFFTCTIIQKST